MNSKKVIKFLVLALSILLVNFINVSVDEYVQTNVKQNFSPHIFTLIGMGLILLIFYPLFTWLNIWSSSFANWFLKLGKHIGGTITGSLIVFMFGLLLLYYLFGKLWCDTNVYFSIIQSMLR